MTATLVMQPVKRSRLSDLLADTALQDGVFAALIVATRIPANAGMIGALIFLILSGFYGLVLRREQSGQTLSRCWLHLTFPAFALLSVAWAVYPAVTLRAAIQMTLTVFAGLLLSQARRPRAVLVGLFVAYAGYTVASLSAGNMRPDGAEGAMALYGLGNEAKNFFADTSGTAALLAIAMLAASLEKRAVGAAALCGLAGVACIVATVRAHSAGAVSSLALAGLLLGFFLLMRKRPAAVKLWIACALVAVFLLGGAFFQPLLAMVQEFSGKDAGLTGRGYLWYRADFIMAERPWLGVGYFGFWNPANPDAIGLWRHFDVRQEGTAFSFHNSYIQTIVETGYLGQGVMVLGWAAGSLALLRRFVLTPSLPTCFWLSYVALQLSKSPVEPIRPSTLIAPTIMLFAALGFGCFPVERRLGRSRHSEDKRRSSSRSIARRETPLVSAMTKADTRLTPPATRM